MTEARELEYGILRAMTPAEKLRVMHALIRQAMDLKIAGLRATRPELTEEQAQELARELLGRDRS